MSQVEMENGIPSTDHDQGEIDKRNIAYWDELCGSNLARRLGIDDDSPANLKKFDDWYFDFYPYLMDYIPFNDVRDHRVLEIGLGYGTVAQRLMEKGAKYFGMDIADGPVRMTRHRSKALSADAHSQRGSALAIPFKDEAFDDIISIGCLHHTGDLRTALSEVHRCLKPGGRLVVMVYSALSYRQWLTKPFQTMRRSGNNATSWSSDQASMRKAYDARLDGAAAPETAFVTQEELKRFLSSKFSEVTVQAENIGNDFPPALLLGRPLSLKLFARWIGLDLYVNCRK